MYKGSVWRELAYENSAYHEKAPSAHLRRGPTGGFDDNADGVFWANAAEAPVHIYFRNSIGSA
jgi:hypothetical protein